MVVRAKGNGREVTGLHVGVTNVRRYFRKSARAVELRMGDLRIECKLPLSFWDGQPEIHDPRVCEWLRFTALHHLDPKPLSLAMVQSGQNSFTLQPVSLRERRVARYSGVA